LETTFISLNYFVPRNDGNDRFALSQATVPRNDDTGGISYFPAVTAKLNAVTAGGHINPLSKYQTFGKVHYVYDI
jgi:hypothetical protein